MSRQYRQSDGEKHQTLIERKSKTLERLPLYGPLQITDFDTFLGESRIRFAQLFQEVCPYEVNPQEFQILSILGEGAFGKVLLVQRKSDEFFYAMKALEKSHIVKQRQVEHVLNEKRILQCIDCPFGIRMEFFGKDNCYVYFYMPFIAGGEMYQHLQKYKRFPEDTARFYAAQVVLALEYLQNLRIAYRDLKPENILIDHLGYAKVTDFGFAKPVMSRTYTFCGTPHYLAPEVIKGHGYGLSIDWWSLGVLIYEMNAGVPPYEADNQMSMFTLILQNKYTVPQYFPPSLQDLLSKLLESDVTRRYGNLRAGAVDVKQHEWFTGLDWLMLLNRKVPSPFIPRTEGQGDVSHFSPSKGSKQLKQAGVNEHEEEFRDF